MTKEYTDDQLKQALTKASTLIEGGISILGIEGQSSWTAHELHTLRAILDRLPAQGRDAAPWQAATRARDFRVGDRARVVHPSGDLEEFTVTQVFEGSLATKPIIEGEDYLHFFEDPAEVYRRPAPVPIPNPAKEPAIYVADNEQLYPLFWSLTGQAYIEARPADDIRKRNRLTPEELAEQFPSWRPLHVPAN